MNPTPKLDLKNRTDVQVVEFATLIKTQMGENAGLFTSPNPPLGTLESAGGDITGLLAQRAAALATAQAITLQIRTARDVLEGYITAEATYVETVVAMQPPAQMAATIRLAGMDVASDTNTPVGPMPKIDGLAATQGDSAGVLDIHWNPIKRGLSNYTIQTTTDPAGQTGWTIYGTSQKSKAELTGLVSGTRYWIRVCANGAAGPGSWSDATTKVAP